MKKYIITMDQLNALHAGSKARRDVEIIARGMKFEGVPFQGNRSAEGRLFSKLRLFLYSVKNWGNLYKIVQPRSMVLIQYPHYPIKTRIVAKWWIKRIRAKKDVKFVALIHDLNSVRKVCGLSAKKSDEHLLPMFDEWICHNISMKSWLVAHGYPTEKLLVLKLFDYISDKKGLCLRKQSADIVVAGSLIPEKAGYVYELIKHPLNGVRFHLYGPGFDGGVEEENLYYHGAVSSEKLPGMLSGSYGLVWDGGGLETCSGEMGEYLRINNPHKVSLYLSAGLPIIIWKEAALAQFVLENDLGLVIESILDIPRVIGNVTPEHYRTMQSRAIYWGRHVRSGEFFKNAISKIQL